jgi:hypothetical protein
VFNHATAADDAPLVPPNEESVYDSYRLPTAVTPEHYKLEVITHLNDSQGFLFYGSVWITVRIKIEFNSILHKNQVNSKAQ